MTGPRWITTCGRICYRTRKINVSQVFAGQKVGVKQVGDHIWLVTFMHYDLGYFNDENLQTRTDQESVRSESVTCFQPVAATISASLAAGVWYPSVRRGRVFSRNATASNCAWLWRERFVAGGKYWRSRPFVFSFEPRCHGLRGSQK